MANKFLDLTGLTYAFTKIKALVSSSISTHNSSSSAHSSLFSGKADASHTHSDATTSVAGFMSATDKMKLNGIATGANNYTHPTTAGNKHIPTGGSSGQILRWSASGTAAWGADNDTTYSAATQSADGLMSSTDKTKLDGIATGANKTTIVNNLTTTAAGSALDAAQGKALNDAIAGKADAGHTHSNYVPTSRTVNGKALSANITLSSSDIGAAPLASPVFTGTPKAPAAATDYTTYRLRNMALVSSAPSSAIGNGQLVGVYS